MNSSYLFAALFWGSVGLGYFIYGKRQGSWSAMLAGIAMMTVSYLVSSVWLMSLICLGLAVAVYLLAKR